MDLLLVVTTSCYLLDLYEIPKRLSGLTLEASSTYHRAC